MMNIVILRSVKLYYADYSDVGKITFRSGNMYRIGESLWDKGVITEDIVKSDETIERDGDFYANLFLTKPEKLKHDNNGAKWRHRKIIRSIEIKLNKNFKNEIDNDCVSFSILQVKKSLFGNQEGTGTNVSDAAITRTII